MDKKRETTELNSASKKFYVFTKRMAMADDEPNIRNVHKKRLERRGFVADTFNDPHVVLTSFQPTPL
ncbi:MAG: hypothetical protein M3270_07750 [Thermoproteota archaeon]|nr:hypothetical protein [Thermoproteota archaeon]